MKDANPLGRGGNPLHSLICWEPYSQKWIDPGNNYFCYRATGVERETYDIHPLPETPWYCSARYGWPDGSTEPKRFSGQNEALTFFVNFLHSRNVELQLQYERRAAAVLTAEPTVDWAASPEANRLVSAILSRYHETRMASTPINQWVLGDPAVQSALKALARNCQTPLDSGSVAGDAQAVHFSGD